MHIYVYVHTKSIHIYTHIHKAKYVCIYTHTYTYIYICLLHFPYLHMWIHIMHTFHTLILFNGYIIFIVAISVVSSCFSFVFVFCFVIKNSTTDILWWLYHFQLLQLMMEIPNSTLHQRVPALCIRVPIFNILQHIANVYPQQISTNSIFLESLPLLNTPEI